MPLDITVPYVLDLLGTASFAFSGALRGLRRRPDFVGMTVLAGATAVGGGVIRDLVLGRPVVMLADMNYPLVILLSVIVTAVSPRRLMSREKFFKYFDALGLGVFSAIGASVAWERGLNPLSVLVVASITGAGGGVIRDVLLNEMPLVLYQEIYVSAVAAGGVALMIASWLGAPAGASFLIAMAVTILLRSLAIHYGWSLPRFSLPGGSGGDDGP